MSSKALATKVPDNTYQTWNRAINTNDTSYLNSTLDKISELDLFNLLQIQTEQQEIVCSYHTFKVSNGNTLLHIIIGLSTKEQFNNIALKIIDGLSASHLVSVFKILNFVGKTTPFHEVMAGAHEDIALKIIEKVSKSDLNNLLNTKAGKGPANIIEDENGDTPLDYVKLNNLSRVLSAINQKI